MAQRRILSLWFPRLAAERYLRRLGDALPRPFAVTGDRNGAQVIVSLDAGAERAGLRPGQPLRDATAMCPDLLTRPANPLAEAAFLTVLRRWAGKFSPWVAEEPPDSLLIDLTGCAHLFGGEAALLAQVELDCADLGLTMRAGIADTPGAAWALARFAGNGISPSRSGDDIMQEARATRSRAAKRRAWDRSGLPPAQPFHPVPQGVIAQPGQMRQVLAPLPVAALRLPPDTVAGLARLGLHRVGDLTGLPRAALARRFGTETLRRLDQALGLETEPVSPARAPLHFAARITFPDPIGLLADVQAGLDRLLPALAARLTEKGRGARRVRVQALRSDGRIEVIEVGLARPAADPARIRPLLWLKLDRIDPGFGIDCLRLEAVETEPVHATRHSGHQDAAAAAGAQRSGTLALEDLLGRLGARLGMDAVTRLHPAESHIPEKSVQVLTAAWSAPAPGPWPAARAPRPLLLFRPEAVTAPQVPPVPQAFRWRRRDLRVLTATGPERIAPEWWLDDPEWRSGPRDYWRVVTDTGDRLWLFFAHGADLSPGWFCHGRFG
ncbi:MAG: DNA polymerase Y family protein [Rhodobacter sp.]|nr:DNA polymerase Y family protein [Rhodobacter sp.]MCA3512675.1 DNA polymerase Y family protein [Rhodobacter sp.]MCA3519879.1 DNA polymerase Y family protein [Rhodobacter sp.]MCA3523096.1 DNA polymerase Y family protein [Rhodobacter sp.]MCA3524745.1 DNA polymerase Y family protein [Rhodobacter sp.]